MVNSICHGMTFLILLGMSFVVRGSTSSIEAVPGQNVSLPCMVDQVNDQQTVKWWSFSGYISSGKEILDSLGLLGEYFAIPGAGIDYSLFIMIPDDMDIWEHFIEAYECRLVSSIDGDFSIIGTVKLQIYQPVSTSLILPQGTEASSPVTPTSPISYITTTLAHSILSTTIPVQPPTLNIETKEFNNNHDPTNNTDVSDTQQDPTMSPDSNKSQSSISKLHFTVAIACTSTAIFILFLIEFYRCYRKSVNNSSDQSTSSLQTMNVSRSGGANFLNVSRDGNEANCQSRTDTVPSLNSQSVDNTLYQESNTAMQTFQQTEDNTALYNEVCELSDATHQTMGSTGIINDVNVDLDNDSYST